MLKLFKRAFIVLAIVCTIPFLDKNFRLGFKVGWNEAMDEFEARKGRPAYPFRKFKNV